MAGTSPGATHPPLTGRSRRAADSVPPMDLGIAGRRAAVAAATAGLGLGAARALATAGVRVAICGRDRGRLAAAAAEVGEGAVGIRADLAEPDRAPGSSAGRRAPRRAGQHPGRQRRRAAGGHLRDDGARRLPRRLRAELPGDDRDVPGGRPRHARARLGAGGGHHVARRAPADGHPDRLLNRPRGGHRLPQGARRREVAGGRRDRQQRPARRPPDTARVAASSRRRPRRDAPPRSPPAGWATRTTSAPSWPCSAPSRPASSSAPGCTSTAGPTAAFSRRAGRRQSGRGESNPRLWLGRPLLYR